jgi:hypothetical protein
MHVAMAFFLYKNADSMEFFQIWLKIKPLRSKTTLEAQNIGKSE